ncbi:MAG: RHS repeat-associated core domain-containing protein [Ardenticatenales bacterium]|nr:RHS repeat-associated core domain-containing protein [Ardenticatenales bacterium]
MLTGGMVGGSRTRYLPFGAYRTAPTQTFTDRGFTGQQHNDDLGLIYYNARYYLPGIARFVSADTVVPDAANPQAFNRYAYVLNNPLILTDPTGHIACDSSNLPGMDQGACASGTDDYYPTQSSTASYIIGAGFAEEGIPTQLADLDHSDFWVQVFRTAAGFISEPLDWVLTGKEIFSGEISGEEIGATILFAALPIAQGGWADDTVTLYRAVSPGELDDIMHTGIFRPHPDGLSMDTKWFSETLEGAKEWGSRMFDEFEVVNVIVPKDIADQMFIVKNLDGIANARAASDDVLEHFNESIINFLLER